MSLTVQMPKPLQMPVLQPLQFRSNNDFPAQPAQPGSAPSLSAGAPPAFGMTGAPSGVGVSSGVPAAAGHGVSIPAAVASNPQMQANWQKASSVCTSLDDMLTTLAEMYEVNAYWKQKFINCKKQHFQKFMGSSKHGLRGMVFAEWKAYTFETGTERKVEGKREDVARLNGDGQALYDKRNQELLGKMEEMESTHQETLAEMAAIIDRQNSEINRLQEQKIDLTAKYDNGMGILKVVKDAVVNPDEETYKVVNFDEEEDAKPFAQNFEYAKQCMHDILNEIDPKYVPPVGSLCVGPPPAPVGTPLLRGVSQAKR